MLKYIYMEWYIEELQFYSSDFNFVWYSLFYY